MFGIGLWELLLIVVVAIIIVPPNQWPTVAEKAGAFWVSFKNVISSLKRDLG